MRVKVFELPDWAKDHGGGFDTARELALSSRKRVDAVFNRPGVYLRRHPNKRAECWIELADGRAFDESAEFVMYCLRLLNAAEYSARQIRSLMPAVRERTATKAQAELVRMYWQTRDLHVRLSMFKLAKRMRARMRVFLEERKKTVESIRLINAVEPAFFETARGRLALDREAEGSEK